MTAPHAGEVMDAEYQQMEEPEEPSAVEATKPLKDEELARIVSLFQLLRTSGYTLKIIPGTPEENAPTFDFETERIDFPAA